MYGFAPGFLFLGGLPQELAIPRRPAPRPPPPPGALLIAAGQALIAGCAMPTGWYAIGRTPVNMFDLRREPIFLAGIGDEIRFEPIDGGSFEVLRKAAEAGEGCARHEFIEELLRCAASFACCAPVLARPFKTADVLAFCAMA